MAVAFSDSYPTMCVVHGRAKPVLPGPNSTETNLFHHAGLDECLNMLMPRRALEKGCLVEGSGGDIVREFNECADCFVTQCVAFVRRHRHYMHGASLDRFHTQLEHILKCLHILHCLRWRTKGDIVLRVEEAVIKSAREWYSFVKKKVVNSKRFRNTF